MENYIVIDGKRLELTEEQIKFLGLRKKVNPFIRVKEGESYYTINESGVAMLVDEELDVDDDCNFEIANYCTNKNLLQQHAYIEILNRLLWRYSMEHDGDEIDFHPDIYNESVNHPIYYIYYDWNLEDFSTDRLCCEERFLGNVLFHSKEIAESAIKEIVKPFLKDNPDFNYIEAM